MMRPVILSSPEKIAVGLIIFCDGNSVITSSPGCGAVFCGGPCTAPTPGGGRGSPVVHTRLVGDDGRQLAPSPVQGRVATPGLSGGRGGGCGPRTLSGKVR